MKTQRQTQLDNKLHHLTKKEQPHTHLQFLEVVHTSLLPHENHNVMWMLQVQR